MINSSYSNLTNDNAILIQEQLRHIRANVFPTHDFIIIVLEPDVTWCRILHIPSLMAVLGVHNLKSAY